VEHRPCSFLSDANGPVDLVGANAVLGIGYHPYSGQPLAEADWAILKDGSGLDGELPPSVIALALPYPACRDEPNIPTATGWASHLTIRPTETGHEIKANVRIREVSDGFNQGLRFGVRNALPTDTTYNESYAVSSISCSIHYHAGQPAGDG
jgi:hypothetical protein